MRFRSSLRASVVLATILMASPGSLLAFVASGSDCSDSWASADIKRAGRLLGVDLLAADSAWAVGYGEPAPLRTLAMRWNGRTWTEVATPNVDGATNALHGVIAIAANDVWAVGHHEKPFGFYEPIAMHWDGTAWHLVTTPTLTARSSTLTGVSGTAADDVWAVGVNHHRPLDTTLIEHWNGSEWSVVASPNVGSESNVLVKVAALSANDAWAVGYTARDSRYLTLTLHWDGDAWAIVPSPNPPGNHAFLADISATPQGVWAVGYYISEGKYRTLAMRWRERAWHLVPSLNPGAEVDVLRAVVVESDTNVWVGGTKQDAKGEFLTLLARWDGSKWTEVTMPGRDDAQVRRFDASNRLAASIIDIAAGKTGRALAVGDQAGRVHIISTCTSPFQTSPVAARRTPTKTSPVRAQDRKQPARPVEGNESSAPRTSVGNQSVPIARDDAASAGIAQRTMSYQAAVGDFDGDGWQDFFLGRHFGKAGSLYRNNQQGGFDEVFPGTFVSNDRHGCAWVDWNGDRRLDLVCAVGGDRGFRVRRNQLWEQQNDGTFVDKSHVVGLNDPFGRGRAVVALDANADGKQDLFFVNDGGRPDGMASTNKLFINTGTRFTSSESQGLDKELYGECVVAEDYDNDGWTDVAVCSGVAGIVVYRNDQGKGFTDKTSQLGLHGPYARSLALVDLNGDGFKDLIALKQPKRTIEVRLQQNGAFRSTTNDLPLEGATDLAVGDINRDGKPDIYVVATRAETNIPDTMLLNAGDGRSFTLMTIPQVSEGEGQSAAAIDYDRNGLTDFIVLNGAATAGPVQLIGFHRNAAR